MLRFTLIFWQCFIWTNVVCDAYKILVVFPFPGKSHSLLGEGYVKHLLKAGHEVTYVTPIPIKNPPPGLRTVDVSSNFELMPSDELLNLQTLMNKDVSLKDIWVVLDLMHVVSNGTIMHKNVQKMMSDKKEQYDVVIAEWMYSELYSGFAVVFGCPLIWSSSMDPHGMVLSLIDEESNPAYMPDNLSTEVPPFTFGQRLRQLWTMVKRKYYKWLRSSSENETFQTAFAAAAANRGRVLPSLEEAKYSASLMLGNSHHSTGMALRLPRNYIHIGGYHIEEHIKPLPQDLKALMDGAKDGVIYFSMGSMLKSKSMPDELKKGLLKIFSGLKQTVLWKFEEQLADLPKNVHILQWAPQPSILSHTNCILFISHGGLLSLTETVSYGVPIIGIPMFADQFTNVNRAMAKGFAKRVDLNRNTPRNLKAAIEDILGDPKYRNKAKELSFVFHHRPVPPGKELVHWVEHVVKTGGAPHLRSPALDVPFYQKAYLDLLALFISILIIIAFAIRTVFATSENVDPSKKYR